MVIECLFLDCRWEDGRLGRIKLRRLNINTLMVIKVSILESLPLSSMVIQLMRVPFGLKVIITSPHSSIKGSKSKSKIKISKYIIFYGHLIFFFINLKTNCNSKFKPMYIFPLKQLKKSHPKCMVVEKKTSLTFVMTCTFLRCYR